MTYRRGTGGWIGRIDARDVLLHHFRDVTDVYIGANQFVYYREGDPSAVVCPDVYVVKGVDNHVRGVFKVWEEGRGPNWVLELTSKWTRHEDIQRKRCDYLGLGVEEYFLFDPEGDYLKPPLQGFRLVKGQLRQKGGPARRHEPVCRLRRAARS